MRPLSATPHDREAIFAACERALRNNSQILTWTPQELADDLQFYLYEASNMRLDEVDAICKEWLEGKKPDAVTE